MQYSARNSKKKSPSSQNHHKLGKVKDSLSTYEPSNWEQPNSTSQASEPGIKLVGVTQDWEGIYGKERGKQEVKFSLYLLKRLIHLSITLWESWKMLLGIPENPNDIIQPEWALRTCCVASPQLLRWMEMNQLSSCHLSEGSRSF